MTLDSSKVPPESYFEEQAALQLLVPRAKLLAALADALGTAPTGDTVTIPRAPTAALLRPFISCPEAELPEAWEAMLRIAATMAGRAVPPAAPGEIVKAIREYLGVHPDLQLGGQVLDSMALELSRIALDYPADLIGALALEELMQLGYTVEAGAILPPRDLPENACEFFGVRPVAVAGPDWDKTRDSLSMLMMGFASNPSHDQYTAWAVLDAATEPGMPLAYLRGAAPAQEAPAALAAKPGGMIAVPFDLVVAACSAIDKKRDAPKILAELRRYTTGDLSRALEAPAAPRTTGYIAPKGRYVPPVLFSPYTGEPRDARDIASDPHGVLIVPPGADVLAAAHQEHAAPWKDHLTARLVNDLRDCAVQYHGAGQLRERIAHIVAPLCDQLKAAQEAPAAPASDTALLDAMTQHRIALVPEHEGPWDAELYDEGEEPRHIGSGATPREALRAALATQAKAGGEA